MSRIYSVDSILGGRDFYDENGNHVGYSVPGIGGGEDFYWDNGENDEWTATVTVDNFYNGGEDIAK